jgi:hypothetical protein
MKYCKNTRGNISFTMPVEKDPTGKPEVTSLYRNKPVTSCPLHCLPKNILTALSAVLKNEI